jgi:hypothetical protein
MQNSLKTDLQLAVASLLSAAIAVDTSNWVAVEERVFGAKTACSRVLSELRTVMASEASSR